MAVSPAAAAGVNAVSRQGLALKALTTPPALIDDRTRVLISLDSKRVALVDTERRLRDRLPGNSSTERNDILEAIRRTINETFLVDARFTEIMANDPFKTPAPAVERALLDAIEAVGRAADQAAAIGVLIQAALDLVDTYKAKNV